MKKLRALAAVLMAVCLITGLTGPVRPAASASDAEAVTNVSAGKKVSFLNRNFTPATNVLVEPAGGDNPEDLVTDGSFDPARNVVYLPNKGWCVIDLGQEYVLSHLVTSFWHIWDFDDVIIEASTDADFSEAITLFNNDGDNSVGRGVGYSGVYQDVSGVGQTLSFSPVIARYVRVTNDGKEGRSAVFDNCSIFTEIQVFAFTGENHPPVADRPSGTYDALETVALSTMDEAEIRYTVNGDYPTVKSALYTAPIDVSGLGHAFRIRAVAIRNGVASQVSNFEYRVGASGSNAAAGKLATFAPLNAGDEESIQLVGFDASADNPSFINDGEFNPLNAVRLADGNRNNAVGWAVIDFGEEYAIDQLKISCWNTWTFYDVIVQLSESADFTTGVTTVYNSNRDGSLIGVAGSDPDWTGVDASGEKTLALAKPVTARYIRVTNDAKNIHPEQFHYVSVFTEIQAFSGGENVALNKPVSAEFFENDVRLIGFNGSTDNSALINDGDFSPTASVVSAADSRRNNAVAWAVVDFGQSYEIDKLVLSFWHEWKFYDVVVQLSESADFTTGVTTIYNSNQDGSLIGAAGTDADWQNVPDVGTTLTLDTPVNARYLRVTNNTKNADNIAFQNMSVFTELQAYSGATNVALNKPVSVSLIGVSNPGETEQVLSAVGFNGSTGGAELITDGSYAPDGALGSVVQLVDQEGKNAVGWAILDLGQFYTVEKINLSFWHEWKFYDVVVQLSESADFTTGVTTIYNNNEDGSIIGVPGTDGVWQNVPSVGTTLTLDTPVKARYLRVTNNTKNEPGNTAFQYMSVFTEIQVYSAAEELPPMQEIVAEAKLPDAFSVGNGTAIKDVIGFLPEALEIVDTSGASHTVHGTWTCDSYVAGTAGDYTFTFVPSDMPANVVDANEILSVQVTVEPAANKTALGARIEEINKLEETLYTSGSWAALTEAKAQAQAVMELTTATQKQVDDALEALNTAYGNLVLRGDKSTLDEAILSVENYNESEYTAISWDAVEAAVERAELVKENIDATQGAVDQAVKAIEDALAGLQRKGNPAPLAERVEELKETQNQNYTPGSWAAFEDAMTAADKVLTAADPSQQEVEEALAALNAAFEGLTEKADKSELNELIGEAESYEESEYTAASFEALESAMKAARTVAENEDASAAEVESAMKALEEAVAQLARLGDRELLAAKIAECEAISGNLYTAESYAALVEALSAAKMLLEKAEILENETQTAIEVLEEAAADLVPLSLNREQLQAALDRAQSIEEGDYTEANYAAFEAALENARSVMASESATQAMIDDAVDRLNRAIDNLEVSKVALEAVLMRAEQVDREKYSAASLAALDEAIADAKAVFNSQNATLEQVKGAEENLKQAIEALERPTSSPWPIVLICLGAVAVLAAAGLLIYYKKKGGKHE